MSTESNTPLSLADTDLIVTQAAQEKFLELLKEVDEPTGVRVFVTGGGCSGMTYGLTFTNEVTEVDHVRERDGLSIVVDSVALNYLRGAEIDYVDHGGHASFVFRNVFQSTGGSGGCGGCGAGGGGGCA